MIQSISYMRVTAMLFIVFYHCLCYYGIWKFLPEHNTYHCIEYWRAACNFALNTFVFISGYLFAYLYIEKERYRNKSTFLRNKTLRLLLPYLFWGIIVWLIFPTVQPLSYMLYGIQHLWFLIMLFNIFFIMIFVVDKVLNISNALYVGGVVVIQIVSKYGITGYPNYFGWSFVLRYFPSFLIGMAVVRYRWTNMLEKLNISKLVVIAAILLTLVVFMSIIPVLPLGLVYMNIPTYALLVVIYTILSKSVRCQLPNSIKSLDACSLGIYIIHHILIWGILFYVPQVYVLLDKHYIISPIIIFVVVLPVSWLITFILSKSKYTAILIG